MKLFFISLGCDKNLTDTERMLGFLRDAGFEITDDEYEAEAAVINTCCFIHDAKQESIESILSTAELKKDGALKYLIVTGCLAERYRDDILREIPEVDAVLGTTAYDELVNVLKGLERGERYAAAVLKSPDYIPLRGQSRVRSDISHYSYLKIAEGCDKHCTYCVIPGIKGPYRSIPFEELLAEARELALDGVNELTVIAQETTLYGTDLYGRRRLPELLKALCGIDGIRWIRLMYCYPEEITDELIDVFATEPKLCHYIDMPIQHASDDVLHRMGRRTDRAQICGIIDRMRARIPDMVFRTSLISGFPAESEEDHLVLKSFLAEYRLDRVGVFTYSREEDTPAYRMKGQIPARVKNARRRELMLVQQEVVFEKNRNLTGQTLDVIIDGRLPEEDVYIGRTYMDAPGVDGCVFVSTSRDLMSGDIIRVLIRDFKGYDLVGDEVQDEDEEL